MRARRCLSGIALLSLAAPCLAQGEGPVSAWAGLEPATGPTAGAYSLGAARTTFDPWAAGLRPRAADELSLTPALRVEFDPAWLSIAARSGEALPAERGAVSRAELDSEKAIVFDDLPGGVLFGLVAQPDFAVRAPRIRASGGRIELVDGADVHPLPVADAAFVRACLAFAGAERADQAAVDIRSSGAVQLAPEFIDTAVGLELIRGDGAPHRRRPDRRMTKSLILDRAALLALDAQTGEVRPQAELEVRFYPNTGPRTAARCLEATSAEGALRAELAECERIAAWVAFFRWARVMDPDGTARVAAAFAGADLGLHGMRTPRWMAPRADAAPPRAWRPSAIDDWMKVHRERVQAGGR